MKAAIVRSVAVVLVSGALGGDGSAQAPARGAQAPTGRAQGAGGGAARGQTAAPRPWFGLPLPPPLGKDPAVIVGDRKPRPVVLPAGEPAAPELVATTIRADLESIVGFSKESRTTKEIGSGQMWGRISGLPSGMKTAN